MELGVGAFQSGSGAISPYGSGLRLVTVGSSYTQQASGWSANKITNGTRGRASWLNYLNNQQFDYDIWRVYDSTISAWRLIGCNQGYGGQFSAEILSRLQNTLALKPDIVDYQGGDNDLSTLTADQIWPNIKAYCDACLKAGVKEVRLNSCFPRMTSASGWPAGNVARKRRNALNRLKRAYASVTPGVTYVNNDQTMLDATSVNGEAAAGLIYDGIHHLQPGALAAARAQSASSTNIGQVFHSIPNDDIYDAVENPFGNLLTNGILAGATGAATGTGAYPTGAQSNMSGTGLTQKLTTLSDGTLELVITTTGTGATSEVAYGGFTFVIAGTFLKDQAFRLLAPVTYLVGPAVLGVRGQIRAAGTVDGAAKIYYAYDMEHFVSSSYPSTYTQYWPCQTESLPGTVRTPSLISESDDTSLRFGIQVYVNTSVAGTTTVRLKGMRGGPVDLPWLRMGVPRDFGLAQAPSTEAQI